LAPATPQALVLPDKPLWCSGRMTYRFCLDRSVLTAIALACKMHDDFYCANSFYAAVGCVEFEEFNLMENCFLSLIDFNLLVYNVDFVAAQLHNFSYSTDNTMFTFKKILSSDKQVQKRVKGRKDSDGKNLAEGQRTHELVKRKVSKE